MTLDTCIRLRYLVGINPESLPEAMPEDHEIDYADITSVGRGYLSVEPERMTFRSAPSRARRIVRAGDTIVSTVRTYLRAVWPVPMEHDGLVVSTGFAVLRPCADLDSRYLGWWCQSDHFIEEIVARSTGVSYPAINASEIGDLSMPVPSKERQRAIADFLDRETARIDALIAKKRRMIELLQTRSESLIAYVLDPLIAKYGEVPVKSLAELRVSDVDKKTYEGEQQIRLCNYTDVYYTRRITADLGMMEATASLGQIAKLALRRGDVLFTKDSETADDIGVPSLVVEDLPGVVLGYHLAMLRPRNVDGAFLYWVLRSRRCKDSFSLAASGVTRFGLRQDAVGRLPVPNLPVVEQGSVVSRIEQQVKRDESMIEVQSRQIQLLGERRQALITAAVTGELDLSEVAA